MSNKQLWIDAEDAHILSLPPGDTLATVDVSSFPLYAARAVSLSKVWNSLSGDAYPIRVSELDQLYETDAWKPWCREKPESPIRCNLLPGNRAFLLASDLMFGVYEVSGKGGKLIDLGLDQIISDMAWESMDGGRSVTLAVLLSGRRGVSPQA